MRAQRFHEEAFDEGTLTKLRIYQLYTREWLPVFLSRANPAWKEVHLFDFFAGPGADARGVPGSPLRLLDELKQVRELPGWPDVRVGVHLFDEDRKKIEELKERVRPYSAELPQVQIQVEAKDFNAAFPAERKLLSNPNIAKLVLINQFGVNYVSNERFWGADSPTHLRCSLLCIVVHLASLP